MFNCAICNTVFTNEQMKNEFKNRNKKIEVCDYCKLDESEIDDKELYEEIEFDNKIWKKEI